MGTQAEIDATVAQFVADLVAPNEARFYMCQPPSGEPGAEPCLACILPPDPTLREAGPADQGHREPALQAPRRSWRDVVPIAAGAVLALATALVLSSRRKGRA